MEISFAANGLLAFLVSVISALFFFRPFISYSKYFFNNVAREFAPEGHQLKASTPTMGGFLVLLLFVVIAILFGQLFVCPSRIILLCSVLFGFVGLWDDLSKVWYKKGISARLKTRGMLASAGIIAALWVYKNGAEHWSGIVDYFGMYGYGLLFLWGLFILIGTSNAVNITDGLDGLASVSLILNFLFYGVCAAYFAAQTGSIFYAGIMTCCSILAGLLVAFFWYNRYPAQIFMGDVGALSFGATLALIALQLGMELYLVLTGLLFVLETLSVMMQVFCFKKYKKRIFKMAPLHHHFELIGWKETKVTTRLSVITLITICIATIIVACRL